MKYKTRIYHAFATESNMRTPLFVTTRLYYQFPYEDPTYTPRGHVYKSDEMEKLHPDNTLTWTYMKWEQSVITPLQESLIIYRKRNEIQN